MIKWLHHLLNPHCPDCRREIEEQNICKSCEVLQYEIERLRSDNAQLMSRLLKEPAPVEERTHAPEPLTRPTIKRVPWPVRRQMLEAEDREKAKLLANAPKPQSIEDLEKELDVAAETRESESGKT